MTTTKTIEQAEAEIVVLREALDSIVIKYAGLGVFSINHGSPDIIRKALAATIDYAEKVVVDKEEYLALLDNCFGSTCHCHCLVNSKAKCWRCRMLARLDSIRKGGEG